MDAFQNILTSGGWQGKRFPAFVLIGVVALAGCESAELRRDATHTYLARALGVLRDCNEEFPKGALDKAVLRAQCQNRALDILRPRYPFPDLLDAYQIDRLDISERFKRKQISVDRASDELLSRRRQMAIEEQKRLTAGMNGADNTAIEALDLVATGQLVCEKAARGRNCF